MKEKRLIEDGLMKLADWRDKGGSDRIRRREMGESSVRAGSKGLWEKIEKRMLGSILSM